MSSVTLKRWHSLSCPAVFRVWRGQDARAQSNPTYARMTEDRVSFNPTLPGKQIFDAAIVGTQLLDSRLSIRNLFGRHSTT